MSFGLFFWPNLEIHPCICVSLENNEAKLILLAKCLFAHPI